MPTHAGLHRREWSRTVRFYEAEGATLDRVPASYLEKLAADSTPKNLNLQQVNLS
jgi:hypothetical protein